jgi:hypothetical protein
VGGLQNNGPALFFRFVLPLLLSRQAHNRHIPRIQDEKSTAIFSANRSSFLFRKQPRLVFFFALSLWPLLVLYAPAISHFNPFLK